MGLSRKLLRACAEFALARSRRRCREVRSSLPETRSILVVKMDALGDFALATPFLRELRRQAPRARITLLTHRIAAPLARTFPHVDNTVEFQLSTRPRRFGRIRQVFEIDRFFRTQLASERFDLALIPRTGPDQHRARLVAWMSGAPCRVGFDTPPADPVLGPDALTNPVAYPVPAVPEPEAHLALLRRLGAFVATTGPLELHCSPADEREIDARLRRFPGADWIVLGVGASLPHKIWPADRFLALARHFVARGGWQVAIVGDQRDAAAFPRDLPGLHNWAGDLTPTQSYALLRRARLLVGNDSAAQHFAAAAQCPTVVVSWASPRLPADDIDSPTRFGPYRVPHRLVRPAIAPEERNAAAVPLEAVLTASEDLLVATRAPHA